MTPKAVLFDCDGVVVDSEPLAFQILSKDLAAHGLPVSDADMSRLFLGGTIPGLFHTARSLGATLPDGWVDDFYQRLYSKLAQHTPLIPGILQVLDALDAKAIPYAIGSNGSDKKMQITLGQYPGLIARFKGHLYSGQTLGKPKPAPDLYLHAARALGVAPADCVVIEDSPTGARAAKAAGIRCYGYAPHPNPALQAEGAQLFTAMKDLPPLLNL